ncbi:MAG: DUF2461 domain-containing protein [Acidobacteriota bacterium]
MAQISPELFRFLRDLRANNRREWFEAHRDRYEQHVREPLLQFVREFEFRLGGISTQFVADARRTGGSLFRIYRDVRFSRDKSPYKTHAALQFRHRQGKNVHAPGFYLHLEPDQCFAGIGIWRPDRPALNRIRAALLQRPQQWLDAIGDPDFRRVYQLGGDSLKRPPQGIDPNHPLIEDLKRTDFVAFTEFTEREATAPDFIDRYARLCAAGTPFMRFLARALGLPW